MTEIDLIHYYELTPRFSYNRFECMGSGTFGKVYKGWDNEKKKLIAVKHMTPVTLKSTHGAQQRQIDILKSLKNPYVMEYYGCHRSKSDGLYLFLEFCEKGELKKYLEKNRLNHAQALDLFKQLIIAMTYVNEKGYLHRDLKPENLLLTKNNQLKVADFGTARSVTTSRGTFRRCTPIYSAPEVYLMEDYNKIDGKYSENCDVFSAGYIFYELLTGEELTKGLQTAQDLNQFLRTNRDKGGFTFDHPALTPSQVQLLKKMLNFDFKARPNFSTVLKQLQTVQIIAQESPKRKRAQRQVAKNQKEQSSQILQTFQNFLQTELKKANYLILGLKALYAFQQEKSQFIPKVYKLLVLFYSLARYCNLSNNHLQLLHTPDLIEVGAKKLEDIGSQLLPADKKILLQAIDTMADKVHKSGEQIRMFLEKNIIPEIEKILKNSQNSLELQVVKQYKIEKHIDKFKYEDYDLDMQYAKNFQKCVNNLYRTRAETQTFTDSDLKIYLSLLYVAQKVNTQKSPSFAQIMQMNRDDLLKKVNQLKKA